MEMWLVCYDIVSPRRLRRVASEVEQLGERLQRSVFECALDSTAAAAAQRRLARLSNAEVDKLLLVPVCRECRLRVSFHGHVPPPSCEPYWIV